MRKLSKLQREMLQRVANTADGSSRSLYNVNHGTAKALVARGLCAFVGHVVIEITETGRAALVDGNGWEPSIARERTIKRGPHGFDALWRGRRIALLRKLHA